MLYHITRIEPLTTHVTRIFLRQQTAEPLIYQAGQYVCVVHADETVSPLSIACAPNADEELEFHLFHSALNEKANALLQMAQMKKYWQLNGPFGTCTVDRLATDQPIIFLARGTGFAPIKAIIEVFAKRAHCPPIHFYWSVAEEGDLYLLPLLQAWKKTFPQFQFTPVFTKQEGSHVPPLKIIADYPDLSHHQVYVSGPKPLVQDAFNTFKQQGMNALHFYSDVM